MLLKMGALGVLVATLLLTTPAHAMGECELVKETYEFLGYSPKYLQFAVKRTFDFCTLGEGAGEPPADFQWSFVEVFQLDGKLRRRFRWRVPGGSWGVFVGDDALIKRLPDVVQPFITTETLERDKIDGHLSEGKFSASPPSKKSPNGSCKLRGIIMSDESGAVPSKNVVLTLKTPNGSKELWRGSEGFTGDLRLDYRWHEIPKKNTRKTAHAVSLIVHHEKGWAPGSPGSVFDGVFAILRNEALADCF